MLPDKPTPRRLPRWLAWYLVAANAILLFLVLELGTRLALTLWRHHARPEAGRTFNEIGEDLHPFLQTTNAPGPDIDSGPEFAGFRVGPPIADDGRCRVMLLGGSTLAFEFGEVLRSELDSNVAPSRIYNISASWHTSLHALYEYWTYVDAVRPDLVIVLHNVNDFARGFTPPGFSLPVYRPDYSHYQGALNLWWEARSSAYDGRPVFYARTRDDYDNSLSGPFAALAHSSALVVELRERWARFRAPAPEVVDFPAADYLRALPAFERNMRNLALAAAARHVPAVFLTMPFTTDAPSRFFLLPGRFLSNDGRHFLGAADFARGLAAFNQAVGRLEAPPAARVLDLAAEVKDPALFRDEVHLSAEGKAQEARLIARFIAEHGLLAGCRETTP